MRTTNRVKKVICPAVDPFKATSFLYPESITAAFQGALQEDIQAGKLIVDLKINKGDPNNAIPFQFSCPVCGASCTITTPKQVDDGKFNELWVLMSDLIRFHSLYHNCSLYRSSKTCCEKLPRFAPGANAGLKKLSGVVRRNGVAPREAERPHKSPFL
jgi:hypothetical protein